MAERLKSWIFPVRVEHSETEGLPSSFDVKEGKAWTAPGDLPVNSVCDDVSGGFLIGVSVSLEVLRAIVSGDW